MGHHSNRKRHIYGALFITILLTNLFLTLQKPEHTVALSESIRLFLEQFGIHSDFHSFRSNAHLLVYFVLGIPLALYGRESGWKWWVMILIGCTIGVIDEGIKALLPTREFDVTDLMRDFIGVAVASCCVESVCFIQREFKNRKGIEE